MQQCRVFKRCSRQLFAEWGGRWGVEGGGGQGGGVQVGGGGVHGEDERNQEKKKEEEASAVQIFYSGFPPAPSICHSLFAPSLRVVLVSFQIGLLSDWLALRLALVSSHIVIKIICHRILSEAPCPLVSFHIKAIVRQKKSRRCLVFYFSVRLIYSPIQSRLTP